MTRSRVHRPLPLAVVLCSTQFLNIVNLSSVSIALPDIAGDLGFGEANLPWVISAYALTFAGFLLVGGRAADLAGRRRILVMGFAVFAAFELVAAVATGPGMLIAARGVQGIGAALMIPASLGILTAAFVEQGERSRALAAFGVGGAAGYAVGLLLGGVVTDALGWRWVFGFMVVPTVALIALSLALVPPDPSDGHAHGRLDLPGAVAATAGLLGLIFALTNARTAGWGAVGTLLPLAAGVGLLVVFLRLQARATDPLMPFSVWRRPNFGAVMAIGVCLYAAWNGVTYFLVLTLQRVLDYSPTGAAVALLPLVAGGVVGSSVAGLLLPRTGPKPILLLGLSVYLAAIGLMALISRDSTYWLHIFVAISLANLGNSCTMVATNVTALSGVAPDERSLAGGLFTTSLQVGNGLGLAVISAVAAASGPGLLPAYQAAFRTALGIAVLGIVIALVFVHVPFSARLSRVSRYNRAENG